MFRESLRDDYWGTPNLGTGIIQSRLFSQSGLQGFTDQLTILSTKPKGGRVLMQRNKTYFWNIRLTWAKHLLVSVIILALCNFTIPWGSFTVAAAGGEDQSPAMDAGLGLVGVILTFPYGVAKILYAAVGGIVGGFTWALTWGDVETAKLIWEPSFYGTYVITPDHLRGEEPIRFMGVPPYEDPIFE